MMRALVFAGLLLCMATAAVAQVAGRFDYYVLSLSWSPTYCAGAARPDALQCGVKRGFVVHGLWPQFERGWPEACPTAQPRHVPDPLKRQYLDLIPSASLIEHEWDAHGVCSGLSQRAYFERVRTLRASVAIPVSLAAPARAMTMTGPALRAALHRANPGFPSGSLALRCRRGQLEEVRACFTKTGQPRRCGSDIKDNCPSGAITLPAN